MKRHLHLHRVLAVFELVIMLPVMAGIVLLAPSILALFPATTLISILMARYWRRKACGWEIEARWQSFWRRHEDVIPEGKPPIPGVVFPPDDHAG